MYDTIFEPRKKNARTRGYDRTSMCSRRLVCYFLVSENYCSLVDIFWKTEIIGELYLVRSTDENANGSVVNILWGSKVVGKSYYVRSADENVGSSVGVCFALFQVVDISFC